MNGNGAHRYDVAVIGAGHNGLAAAALLAKQGRRVIVLEQREQIGGTAAGDEFHLGYRSSGMLSSQCPIDPRIVAELELAKHGLQSCASSPVFIPQIEGRGLLLHDDPHVASEEIARHSRRDAVRYVEFRDLLRRLGGFVTPLFRDPLMSLATDSIRGTIPLAMKAWALKRLGRKDMLEFLRIVSMCVADWLGEWFETDLLRSALAVPAISGSFAGPWSPGTNAALIRHYSISGDVAKNGPDAAIRAIHDAAESHGVTIQLRARVAGIEVADHAVRRVILQDGGAVEAETIAASCDPKQTFLKLVGCQNLPTKLAHRIAAYRMRGTAAKVDLALNKPLRFTCRPDLQIRCARIAERTHDIERAFDAAKYGLCSERPVLEIDVPTVNQPDLAPSGHAVVSILAHFAPYDLKNGWNDAARERLGDAVVGTLGHYVSDLQTSIIARRVLSPLDIEQMYGLTGGHLFHGEFGLDQMIVRPTPECSHYATPIGGLFLCGSGSHPGGGVIGACGYLAARHILRAVRQ